MAYTVVSHDGEGPLAVSLSAGVALRRSPRQFQFVCPQAWGDQFASPVAALADGTLVIGATTGLFLLAQDGSLRTHPDPAAMGRSSDVVRSALGVFSLRPTPEGSEVLAVDSERLRVLWKDPSSFYSLAAVGDELVLVRASEVLLTQVELAAGNGVELARRTAAVDVPVDYVFARGDVGAAYTLVVARDGSVVLGQVGMNAFTKLAQGALSIAGPLTVDGVTLVALDGKLAQLRQGQALQLADDHEVVCLAEREGLEYACVSGGISSVRGPALDGPLFRFEWLTPPDLERVPEGEDRLLCSAQWQDLQSDMQLLAPGLADAPALEPMTVGADAPVAGESVATGGVGTQGTGGTLAAPAPQAQAAPGTGCSTLPVSRMLRSADVHAFVGLALMLNLVRRQRRRLTVGARARANTQAEV